MAFTLPNLGPRARKAVRYLGFAILGLVTFVFAFQAVFPFNRVKDRVIDALSEKYDVTIGSVDRGFLPGRVYFKAVTLRTRPAKADDVATTFYIERLEVNLGILALLRGTVAVSLDAKIGPGHIAGSIALSKDNTSIDVVGYDLPSVSLPMREVIGLPMSGKLRFSVALELPSEKAKSGKVSPNWTKAVGAIELACPSSCVIGDGKSKLKTKLKNARSQAMAEGGIEFGKVNIDSLLARVEIKKGKMEITKFDAKTGDGELHVDLDVALNQDLNQSLVTGCLRFRGSDALMKREPKTHSAISLTGAQLGPDNLFHIKLDGPVREIRKLGQTCGEAVNTSMDNPGGPPARPNLTVTPETPPPPVVPAGIPPPATADVLPPPPAPVPVAEDAGVSGAPGAPGTPPQVSPQGEPMIPNGAVPPAPPGAPGSGVIPAVPPLPEGDTPYGSAAPR
jgi:type II secretion system protein N